MDDLVEVVDKEDRIVRIASKSEAHKNCLPHRISAVFIFNEKGELIVQRRAKRKNGLLDNSVAGHVSVGETYIQAALRELKEEAGVTLDLVEIGAFYSDESIREAFKIIHIITLYEAKLPADKALVPFEEEVSEFIPMNLNLLAEKMRHSPLDFTPGFLFGFNYYVNKKRLPIEPIVVQ